MRAGTWLPLKIDGEWNPALRDSFHERSGAYAVRDRSTGTVLYVGESHCDRGWKTLLRHFQDPTGKFRKLGEWTHGAPERLDAAIWPTSRGDEATKKEHALIQRLKPTGNTNTNEIRAAECKSDTDFAFGANVKNPAKPKAPAGAVGYEARGVLGDAYRGRSEERATVTHAVWIDASQNEIGSKTVCGRIPTEKLADVYGSRGDAVTCSACAARVASSSLPRVEPNPKRASAKKANPAPTPMGVYPREVDSARPAYDRGFADAVLLHARDLTAGMSNANIKFPPGSTRATAYVWGWWHAIATGATAKRRNPESAYAKTHGGLGGDWTTKRVRVPDPKRGKLTVMGRLKRVEYETDKGEGASVYFHDFGREHANGEERGRVKDGRKPWLVFNEDGLIIAGGEYVVREEGIVG